MQIILFSPKWLQSLEHSGSSKGEENEVTHDHNDIAEKKATSSVYFVAAAA